MHSLPGGVRTQDLPRPIKLSFLTSRTKGALNQIKGREGSEHKENRRAVPAATTRTDLTTVFLRFFTTMPGTRTGTLVEGGRASGSGHHVRRPSDDDRGCWLGAALRPPSFVGSASPRSPVDRRRLRSSNSVSDAVHSEDSISRPALSGGTSQAHRAPS